MNWFSQKITALQDLFNEKTSTKTPIDLNTHTVAELRSIAKSRGLRGYTQLRKAQLIEMIQQN